MSLCDECIIRDRCNGACAEVDGGVNEAFERENDYYDGLDSNDEYDD